MHTYIYQCSFLIFFQVLFSIVSVLTLKQTSIVSNPEVANEEREKYLDFWKTNTSNGRNSFHYLEYITFYFF